jgi:quinol monooxygenase YgiN
MIYVLWEFTVSPEHRSQFEITYKSDGIWAELFRRDPAYRETILIKDQEQAGRYLTVDVWEDRESYLNFKHQFADQYSKIDEECEKLTSGERLVGIFEQVSYASACDCPPVFDAAESNTGRLHTVSSPCGLSSRDWQSKAARLHGLGVLG